MAEKEFAETGVVVIDGVPFVKFGDKLVANKGIHADCGKLVVSNYNTAKLDFGSSVMEYNCEGCGAPVIRSFDPVGGWSLWRTYRGRRFWRTRRWLEGDWG